MKTTIFLFLGLVVASFAISPPVVPPPPGDIIEVRFQYKRNLTDPAWETLCTKYTTASSGFFRTVIEK